MERPARSQTSPLYFIHKHIQLIFISNNMASQQSNEISSTIPEDSDLPEEIRRLNLDADTIAFLRRSAQQANLPLAFFASKITPQMHEEMKQAAKWKADLDDDLYHKKQF
ncbi:uncharacterized protein LOC129580948 [Paramacrobiotus metropolitanus]|uniref:uncharacterized protein LOC129580948 n=1 Tax=Paramacrobiotus metropolitanus TaxID=2943436 RepID=UPI00244564D6|nr:uncharacterized protein LOC129580948 [Paramacrobiotus metropolitanus]